MWPIVFAILGVAAMMLIRLIAVFTAHRRADKAETDKLIKEARDALKKAYKANPDDVHLHSILADRIRRLRGE